MAEAPEMPVPDLQRQNDAINRSVGRIVMDSAAKDAYIEELRDVIQRQAAEIAALKETGQEHAALSVLKNP